MVLTGGKPKYWEKNMSHCHSVQLDVEPGLHGERLEIKHEMNLCYI